MSTHVILKLINISPTHLGLGNSDDSSSYRSFSGDMFSSALASIKASKKSPGDIKAFLNSFLISDAFPFFRDSDNIDHFFFPANPGPLRLLSELADNVDTKQLKKARFIESSLLSNILNASCPSGNSSFIQLNDFIINHKTPHFRPPLSASVNQRVSVDVTGGNDTVPFYYEWAFFEKTSGLFTIFEAEEPIAEEIITLMKELGEVGIGGDKSVGGGHFDIEVSSIDIPSVSRPNAYYLLSPFIPSPKDLDHLSLQDSIYTLIRRGGYMAGSSSMDHRHFHKKSVYMFQSGSILKSDVKPNGAIVDLTPDGFDIHPVFRSGRTFCLPASI